MYSFKEFVRFIKVVIFVVHNIVLLESSVSIVMYLLSFLKWHFVSLLFLRNLARVFFNSIDHSRHYVPPMN